MSYLTIIVLAILVIAVVLMMKRSRDASSSAANDGTPDPLAHDHDGLNRPLPGQSARTEGEVSDAARSHVGGHLDADEAARAARDSENTGGTGTAVLAGVATAGGAAAAAGSAAAAAGSTHESPPADRAEDGAEGPKSRSADEPTDPSGSEPDEDRARSDDNDIAGDGITNPPVPETAGGLEPHGRHEREPVTSANHPAPHATAPLDAEGELAGTAGDGVSTNAPVADGDAPEPHAAVSTADPAADPNAELTSPPVAESAGEGEFRDRSNDARSNAVAGTASLAVGGATAAGEVTRLPDGTADLENRHGENSDRQRLGGGDTRAEVREMIKILNLREGDAGRLDLSKDDFASLWRADAGTSDTLVDETAARLRRMLGHENP